MSQKPRLFIQSDSFVGKVTENNLRTWQRGELQAVDSILQFLPQHPVLKNQQMLNKHFPESNNKSMDGLPLQNNYEIRNVFSCKNSTLFKWI